MDPFATLSTLRILDKASSHQIIQCLCQSLGFDAPGVECEHAERRHVLPTTSRLSSHQPPVRNDVTLLQPGIKPNGGECTPRLIGDMRASHRLPFRNNVPLVQLGYKDKAWSVNTLSGVARHHGCYEACNRLINTLYGFNAMEVQEAFAKIRQQVHSFRISLDPVGYLVDLHHRMRCRHLRLHVLTGSKNPLSRSITASHTAGAGELGA